MNWLVSLFATRRELKRLTRDLKESRTRISSLENRERVLIDTLAARDAAWADRFLTAQVKTYAIGDEAAAKVKRFGGADNEQLKEMLAERLATERMRLEQDAELAGMPPSAVDDAYNQIKTQVIEDFGNEFGFNN